MKFTVLLAISFSVLFISVVLATDSDSVHLRVHAQQYEPKAFCRVPNGGDCNGNQLCCMDPNYECRLSIVKGTAHRLCVKKIDNGEDISNMDDSKMTAVEENSNRSGNKTTNSSVIVDENDKKGSGAGAEQPNLVLVDVWRSCTKKYSQCNSRGVCVKLSPHFSQCLPLVLPRGSLCGQHDGTNEWLYDHCEAPETCVPNLREPGSYRCKEPK